MGDSGAEKMSSGEYLSIAVFQDCVGFEAHLGIFLSLLLFSSESLSLRSDIIYSSSEVPVRCIASIPSITVLASEMRSPELDLKHFVNSLLDVADLLVG